MVESDQPSSEFSSWATFVLVFAAGGAVASALMLWLPLGGQSLAVRLVATVLLLVASILMLVLFGWSSLRGCVGSRESDAGGSELDPLTVVSVLGGDIAHDVNQPLTAIANIGGTWAYKLSKGEPPSDWSELRTALDEIESHACHAGEIVHRLKGVLRGPSLDSEPCSVLAEVQRVVKRSKVNSLATLKFDPDGVESMAKIRMNRSRFREIVGYVLESFISSNGRSDRTVTVALHSGANAVRIEVAGTTPGLQSDAIAGMLGDRQQRGTMSNGLMVCELLVKQNSGQLTWETKGGQTTAVLEFPRSQD